MTGATAVGGVPVEGEAFGRAGRAALVVLAVRVAGAGLAFLTQLLLARLMGPANYGVFATLWVWIAILGHGAVLGAAQAACRFVPEHLARGELAEVRGFLAAGAGLSAAGSLTLAGLGVLLLWLHTDLIGDAYRLPALVALAVLPFFALQDFCEGAARGFEWQGLAIAPVYVLRQGLLAVLVVAAVSLGAEATPAVALAAMLAAIAIAVTVQAALLVRRLRKTLPPGPRAFRLRLWAGASLPMALVDWTVLGLAYVDVLILSLFRPPEEVAVYFAATRILQLAAFVPYAASAATVPTFAGARARGAEGELRALVRRTARLTFVATLGAGLAAGAAGPWLFALFGTGFESGLALLAILVLGIAAHSAAGPAEDLLTMLGQERLCTAISGVALLAAVALHLLLIPALGAPGAALATALVAAGRAAALAWAVRARLGFRSDILSRKAQS
jgi:O-antigen/teichoic acid export membrane protein